VTVTKGGAQMIKTVSYGKEKKFVAGEVTPLSIASFEGVAVNLGRNYTSYTLFKEGNAQANSVDAGTIYFEGDCSFAGISSTLVKECGVNINGSNVTATASNKKFKIANQTGKGQGTYKVYAYIKTVDGTVYKSAEQTHYITGLPYSISFGNTTSPSGWSVGNTMIGKTLTHSFNIFSFGNGDAYALSPKFYIPATTTVTATFKMYAYTTTNGKFKPSVYISASENDVASNKVATLSSQRNTYGTATVNWSYPAATVNLTSSVGKICVHTSGTAETSVVFGSYYPCIPTESCTINYAF
jgi:hypothetical protein